MATDYLRADCKLHFCDVRDCFRLGHFSRKNHQVKGFKEKVKARICGRHKVQMRTKKLFFKEAL